MAINNFVDGELISAPRMNEMVDQLNTRYYTVDQSVGRVVKVWDYLNNREQIIYGDTGWRQIKADLPAGYAASNLWIIRRNSTITVNMQSLATPAGTASLYTLPTGYKPDGPSVRTGVVSDGTSVRMASPFGSTFRLLNMPGSGLWEGSVTFTTSDPWPTSLPGVAA